MKANEPKPRTFTLCRTYEGEINQATVEKFIGMPWDMVEKTYNKDGSIKKFILPDPPTPPNKNAPQ